MNAMKKPEGFEVFEFLALERGSEGLEKKAAKTILQMAEALEAEKAEMIQALKSSQAFTEFEIEEIIEKRPGSIALHDFNEWS
jgi:hypothetical protein